MGPEKLYLEQEARLMVLVCETCFEDRAALCGEKPPFHDE